jgi:DNA-binding transcriptional LysR family regulator
MERHELLTDPVVLAVGRNDPLHTSARPESTIDLAALADRDWLVPDLATTCHQMVEHACRAAGYVPRAIAQCIDFPAMLALVGVGEAIALVPRLATYQLPDSVALHPISPGTVRHIFALTRPGGTRHPAVRVVLDHLTKSASRRAIDRASELPS